MTVFNEKRKARCFKLLLLIGFSTTTFYIGQITKMKLPAETLVEDIPTTSTYNYEDISKAIPNFYLTNSVNSNEHEQDVINLEEAISVSSNESVDLGGNPPQLNDESSQGITDEVSSSNNKVNSPATANDDENKKVQKFNSTPVFHRNIQNKLVLFWTKFTRDDGSLWWCPKNGYHRTLRMCDYSHCEFTDDKSRIEEADIVLFKDFHMDYERLTWPEYRSLKQLYVHYLGERPGKWHNYIKDYGRHINLTMNYRKSADISVPFQQLYSRARQIPGSYKLRIPLRNKTRMAVWPVSHCIADSKRQDYVKELSKYIDVDIYGRCGNYSCPKTDPFACYPQWERTYKFYLAFENAICDDYITEKFYKPLRYELVPVILSGHRYNSETPPHASIDVRDFKSPRDLAKYLLRLAQNEQQYSKYFDWKHGYGYRASSPPAICKICEAVHIHKNKPARTDYYDYWFSACDNGLVDRMRAEGKW